MLDFLLLIRSTSTNLALGVWTKRLLANWPVRTQYPYKRLHSWLGKFVRATGWGRVVRVLWRSKGGDRPNSQVNKRQ